uniref:DUF4614 domain-containing protein n=1 Tax=Anser brachyrhynchus TaxID=132585 RepID=A0A8B9C5M7_9AVES
MRSAGEPPVLPRSGSELRVGEVGMETAGRAPWHRSRFLKVQAVEVRGNQRCQVLGSAVQAMNRGVAKGAPGGTAHTRSSSALRKVAQLESKIMNRKKQMELQNADFSQKPLDEESLSSASSHEHSTRGKKYLKNYATASRNTTVSNAWPKEEESIQSPIKSGTVKQKLGLDTGEKEMREFTENSLEFPSGNENRRVITSDSKWSYALLIPLTYVCLILQGTDIQITQESNRNPKKDTFQVEKDQPSLKISAVTGVSDPSEGDTEKNVTEADISEHLGEVSADFSRQGQDYPNHDERTVNSEYSEDFEKSMSTTDGEAVSEMPEEHSESSTYSGKDPSSSTSTPLLTRERRERVHRVTVKETAVQTVDSPFTYCWSKTLTAYSPSVLVLNAMLKQHLTLTQQFVENIQHLHLCLVESLENEKFHYHTLEEAKEYIKNHRSPPLTLEQAREEIQKAQEEKLL